MAEAARLFIQPLLLYAAVEHHKNDHRTSHTAFNLKGFDTFRLKRDYAGNYWFGIADTTDQESPIELILETNDDEESSDKQLKSLIDFSQKIEELEDKIFQYMEDAYRGSHWERTKEELKKMYFLISLTLKRDSEDWWIVLEPQDDVPTIFNHFQRFTIRDNQIVWSNIK